MKYNILWRRVVLPQARWMRTNVFSPGVDLTKLITVLHTVALQLANTDTGSAHGSESAIRSLVHKPGPQVIIYLPKTLY